MEHIFGMSTSINIIRDGGLILIWLHLYSICITMLQHIRIFFLMHVATAFEWIRLHIMFRRHSTVAHLYLKNVTCFFLVRHITSKSCACTYSMLTKHFGTHPRSSNLFNEATYDSCRTKSISEFESCSHRVRKQRICVQTNCYHARIVSSTRIFMTYSQLTKNSWRYTIRIKDSRTKRKLHPSAFLQNVSSWEIQWEPRKATLIRRLSM